MDLPMESGRSMPMSTYGMGADIENFHAFLRDRFRSEPEAASFMGGAGGMDTMLGLDEFARALRMAGYRQAPEPLFNQLAEADGVLVGELLHGSGLPREPPSSLPGQDMGDTGYSSRSRRDVPDLPMPQNMQQMGLSPHMEGDIHAELEDLRREIAELRIKTHGSNAPEARSVTAKLEETLSRETVALRADNADLRASVTEALRLLSEERKERQNDMQRARGDVKELQQWAEERTQQLDSTAKVLQSKTGDHQTAHKQHESDREMTEHKLLAAISEEVRQREAAVQNEQQTRETMMSELEGRFRALMNEERQLRGKETGGVSNHLSLVTDGVRADRDTFQKRLQEAVMRMEDIAGDLREEARQRQQAIIQVNNTLEDLRADHHDHKRDQKDTHDDHGKRASALESGLQQHIGRIDKDIAYLKQSSLDLRSAVQLETATRDEAVSRLQTLLNDEAHAREDAVETEMAQRDASENRVVQQLRAMLGEEKASREEACNQLEAKFAALQHEHNFEKAKAVAQARELSQALVQARETLGGESTARRHELGQVSKTLEELRQSLGDESTLRDKTEARIQEQVNALDNVLRKEIKDREGVEKKALGDTVGVQEKVQKLARMQDELSHTVSYRLDEERKHREDGDKAEAKAREEATNANLVKIEALIKEVEGKREETHRALEHKTRFDEQARNAEKEEREHHQKHVHGKIGELGDDLADIRMKLRDALGQGEELALLKEAHTTEKADRMANQTNLDLSVKEHQQKLDQAVQAQQTVQKLVERKIADIVEKLDQEVAARCRGDQDTAKQLAAERSQRAAEHAQERRALEEIIASTDQHLREQAQDEKNQRTTALNSMDIKLGELRETCDEVKRWRNEQYNELILELSKVAEMLTEEAKARQQQDQVLHGELARLHQQSNEETNARKVSDNTLQQEIAEALKRLDGQKEAQVHSDKEQWREIQALKETCAAECSRRESADAELRQMLEKETHTREEVLAGSTRAWQKAQAKLTEEWRNAVRAETTHREDGQVQLHHASAEIRGAMQDTRAVLEQLQEEIRQRFKGYADAASDAAAAHKTAVAQSHKSIDEVKAGLAAEQAERMAGERHTADRCMNIESQQREETALRDEGQRRLSKELMDQKAELQAEQQHREEGDLKLEQRLNTAIVAHEEMVQREGKQRELIAASHHDALQKGLRDVHSTHDNNYKDIGARVQQLIRDSHQEHEERVKADREIAQALTRLQSELKEEEENREETGERLDAAIGSLRDGLHEAGVRRDEAMKKCMESVDSVRSALNKEVIARTSKAEALDEAVKQVTRQLKEEVHARDVSVRAVADSVMEEATRREEAIKGERRSAEQELVKGLQSARKPREEAERALQERILEVSAAVSEERGLRAEAMRQERSKLLEVKDELAKNDKVNERELVKLGTQVAKQIEDQVGKIKDLHKNAEIAMENATECRNNIIAEVNTREQHVASLTKQVTEAKTLVAGEATKRESAGNELKKFVEEEIATLNNVVAGDRRTREAGDISLQNTMKAALRDERDAREAVIAQIAKDVTAVKGKLTEEGDRREAMIAQNSSALQKLKAELLELQGERKVDSVAMKEAFAQATEELKNLQRIKKEDSERIEAVLTSLSTRVDASSRTSREQIVAVEHSVNLVQAELQREVETRTSSVGKLEARIGEEKRVAEGCLAVETKNREDAVRLLQEDVIHRVSEEANRQKGAFAKVASQVAGLHDDIEKNARDTIDKAAELAKGISALTNALASEEQARLQNAGALQHGIDIMREEIAAEAKERRTQWANTAEDVHKLHRSLHQRDDRTEALAGQMNAEAHDLRDRIAKETRLREAALAAMDQKHQHATSRALAIKDAPHNSQALAIAQAAAPSNAEWKEFQQQTGEDLLRQRRQLEMISNDQQATSKAVTGLTDRVDTMRTGFTTLNSALAEVQMKQKALSEVETQVRYSREEVLKETAERRTEDEKLARMNMDLHQKMDKAEQMRLKTEEGLRQEVMSTKATLKKELREHEANVHRVSSALREEAAKREEALDKERKARQEHHEHSAEAFHGALREERRNREKEALRLEKRAIQETTTRLPPSAEGGAVAQAPGSGLDPRAFQQALADIQDRFSQVEQRQKSAEERTVNMLDAIMSGLTGAEN